MSKGLSATFLEASCRMVPAAALRALAFRFGVLFEVHSRLTGLLATLFYLF